MWKLLEILAWTAGALCLGIWVTAQAQHQLVSRAAMARAERLVSTPSATVTPASPERETRLALRPEPLSGHPGGNPEAAFAEPDRSLWSASRISHYRQALESENGSEAIGLIEIPATGLRAPLFSGIDEWALNAGVGLVPDTAGFAAGNTAIAGHRDGFFRKLKDIEVGDRIEVSTELGRQQYEVRGTFVVKPEDTWVLEPTGGHSLTLVTCYPFYFVGSAPERFIVRAELVSPNHARSDIPPTETGGTL